MTQDLIQDSPTWSNARPVLSVLIPFLGDDPTALLQQLDREADVLRGAAEVVVLDDGTGDPTLTRRLAELLSGLGVPARLITLTANLGRAKGRNRLAQAARSEVLLFLDSDMRADRPDFLTQWIAVARERDTAVAFGGISLLQAPRDARFAVHRAMAARSDCVPCAERARQPEKYVFTSNLLVRRDVLAVAPFDGGFAGWGWEDVEWALRVSRRWPILHIDNPATHMGLDTVDALAAKYEQSAPNFALMAQRHRDDVAAWPSYRAARLLARAPGLRKIRPWMKCAARTRWLPVSARAFSLRLYRTALYAEAVG